MALHLGLDLGAQVGRRAHRMLLAHMQRHVYSATGALRWKRDITEYADVLRTAHSPAIAVLVRAHPPPLQVCRVGYQCGTRAPVQGRQDPTDSFSGIERFPRDFTILNVRR